MDVIFDPNRQGPAPGPAAGDADVIKDGDQKSFMHDVVEASRQVPVLVGLLRDHEWVHFHPLINSMTTAIRPADLLRFLVSLGHRPEPLELPPPAG